MTDDWCQNTLNKINASITQTATGCGLSKLNSKQIARVAATSTIQAVQDVLQQDTVTSKLATASNQSLKESIKTKNNNDSCGLLGIVGCNGIGGTIKMAIFGIIILIALSVLGGIIYKIVKARHAPPPPPPPPPPSSNTDTESSSSSGTDSQTESESDSEDTNKSTVASEPEPVAVPAADL